MIAAITWGHNAKASLQAFARVVFSYKIGDQCNGVYTNSQIDYRTGVRVVTGASLLQSLTITAHPPGNPSAPVHTRRINLDYDRVAESCGRPHAPLRQLKAIRETAFGVDAPTVTLPPVTFDYNDPGVTLVAPQTSGYAYAPWGFGNEDMENLGWGYRREDDRWPTIESMFLDVDGDGLQDVITNAKPGTLSECEADWHRNLGVINGEVRFHGYWGKISLPRLKWHGATLTAAGSPTAERVYPSKEGCALNGQVTAYRNAYGLPGTCHHEPGASCVGDPDSGLYCYPGGTRCPEDPGGPWSQAATFRTYLAYRWFDMDADGLTDLVAAVHGDIDSYDIERGNTPGFTAGEPSIWGIPAINQWPSCPRDQEKCKQIESCFDGRFGRVCTDAGCSFDWAKILQCISTSVGTGCSNVLMKAASGPDGAPPASVGVQRHPYERCEGLHPWLIYWNQGGGTFAKTPTVKYQPVPLESTSGDASLGGGLGMTSENHAITDFDGDGLLDAVVRATKQTSSTWTSPAAWQVWLGDGTGGFGARRLAFPTRTKNCPSTIGDCPYGANALSATGGTWGLKTLSLAGLLDVNGDGALDHWLAFPSSGNADIAFNDGEQLKLNGYGHSGATGDVMTPAAVKPGNDTHVNPTKPAYPVNAFVRIKEGTTTATNRVVDVDHDGRQDVVTFASPTASPVIHFNVGESFIAPGVAAAGSYEGLRRQTQARENVTAFETQQWQLNSDLIDLDGDGISEDVSFTAMTGYRRAVPLSPQPPRLLKAVRNGRGAHSTITYSQMHDTNVVVQSPTELWPDGRPKASPRAQWVVKSLHVRDDVSNTDSTLQYKYRNPRYGADKDAGGGYSFRGFEEVTTTKPGPSGDADGARTVQRYAYDVDATGRLVETVLMPSVAEGAADARTIDRTSWQPLTLFGGMVRTYHTSVSEHYECANGQNEAACRNTPAGRTRTTLSWTTNGQLWMQGESLLKASNANVDGDRRTQTTYYFKSGSDQYVLRPADTTLQERVAGTWRTYGKSRKTWNAAGAQLTDEVWVDNDDARRAITRFDVDKQTGNTLATWKPVQWSANPNTLTNLNRTAFHYDDQQLFVRSEVNELGHTLEYVYEYGTGTRLETRGPNVTPCVKWNYPCTPGAETIEIERIRVDGLGRTLERFATFANPGYDFRLFKVETNTYVDGVGSKVIHQNAIDHDRGTLAVRYAKDMTELDGRGRPIRKTLYVNGSAPADAITTYAYRGDGTLARVTLPNPTKNDASTVAYTYSYDSLGRPTGIRRADGGTTGIDLRYNGLVQTSTEIVGGVGKPATTRTTKDNFGRLVRVEEQIAGGAWASTEYRYDASDNIRQIIDPVGVTTTLEHDFAGRRTKITRANRAWKYAYDANGNMRTETSPCTGLGCDALYTTSIVYDALDRAVSRSNAPRALSAGDLATFGSSTETFEWDTDANSIGRLVRWKSFAPNAAEPTNEVSRSWNLQGQRYGLYESFSGAGYEPLSRSTQSEYELSGSLGTVHYGDETPDSECPHGAQSFTQYDARGLPSATWIMQCPMQAGAVTLVHNDRNVAGLVTKRYSAPSSGPFTYVESTWKYDQLGRVSGQTIKKGTPLTQVARQDVTYNGNDDPRTLDHWLGATNRKRFTFGYDDRHQLTSVGESANAFTATYNFDNAGRFKRAKETAASLPGSEVKPRDVTYRYAGVDPEQVTALMTSTGATYATFTYDPAGNQITRAYPSTGESWQYVYDGKNQLRRAIKRKSGAVVGSEEYWYDDANVRQIIVKRDAFATKTEMRWFIGDTEAHYDEAGDIKRVYSHISMGTPLARIERSSSGSSALEYQFHGLANNTLAAVDQTTGAVNASFVYAPFGEIIEATDAGNSVGVFAHRRRMNDKYVDEITGLGYYGYRYYDNLTMTWTQSDPLYRFEPDAAWTDPRRAALYTMTLNNPLRYIDPDGRESGVAAATLTGARVGATYGASFGPQGAAVGAAVGATVAFAAAVYTAHVSAPALRSALTKIAENTDGLADSHTSDTAFLRYKDYEAAEAQRATDRANYQATLDAFNKGVADGMMAENGGEGSASSGPTTESSTKPEERARQNEERMSEDASLNDALEQLNGISNAQTRARKGGAGDATIQSTKKSQQNVDNRLKRIKSAADLDDDDLE